jgi:hypothetical protein
MLTSAGASRQGVIERVKTPSPALLCASGRGIRSAGEACFQALACRVASTRQDRVAAGPAGAERARCGGCLEARAYERTAWCWTILLRAFHQRQENRRISATVVLALDQFRSVRDALEDAAAPLVIAAVGPRVATVLLDARSTNGVAFLGGAGVATTGRCGGVAGRGGLVGRIGARPRCTGGARRARAPRLVPGSRGVGFADPIETHEGALESGAIARAVLPADNARRR